MAIFSFWYIQSYCIRGLQSIIHWNPSGKDGNVSLKLQTLINFHAPFLTIMFILPLTTGHLFWKAIILGGLYRGVPLYSQNLVLYRACDRDSTIVTVTEETHHHHVTLTFAVVIGNLPQQLCLKRPPNPYNELLGNRNPRTIRMETRWWLVSMEFIAVNPAVTFYCL